MELAALVSYLDGYLRVAEVPDAPHAVNGLQVANAGAVSRVATAVDLCEATVRMAAEQGADFLLVHHGDRKSTRLNSSHGYISYAVFCLKKKKHNIPRAHGPTPHRPDQARPAVDAVHHPADEASNAQKRAHAAPPAQRQQDERLAFDHHS